MFCYVRMLCLYALSVYADMSVMCVLCVVYVHMLRMYVVYITYVCMYAMYVMYVMLWGVVCVCHVSTYVGRHVAYVM